MTEQITQGDGPLDMDYAVGLLSAPDPALKDAPAAQAEAPVEHDDEDGPEIAAEEADDTAAETPSGDDDDGQDEPEGDGDVLPAIDPPQSWTAEEKKRFAALPRETQEYLAKREADRDAFVSRKANEAAEHTRAATAERNAYAQQLAQVDQFLQAQIADAFAGIDWVQLAQESPAEYVEKRALWEQRQQQFAAVQAEQQRLEQIFHAEQQQAHQHLLTGQKDALIQADPVFADPEKAKSEVKAIRDYLGNAGFQPTEIDGLVDHRAVLLIRKAMRFDAAQKARTEKRVATPPPVQKSGTTSKTARKAASADALYRRLEQTGSIEDAVALLTHR